MAILHAGHEAGAVRLDSSAGYTTEAGTYNSTHSRSAIVAWGQINACANIDVTANFIETDVWFHGVGINALYTTGGDVGETGASILRFINDGGAAIIDILVTTPGSCTLRLFGNVQTDMIISGMVETNIRNRTIDIQAWVAGEFLYARVFINGEERVTAQASGVPGILSSIRLGSACASTSVQWYYRHWCWSELIVATEDTRGMYVKTTWPIGAGQYSESIGGYSNVDEVISDALVAEFVAADQRLTVTHSGIGTPTGQVLAVVINGRANSDATTMPVRLLRVGNQDFTGSTPVTLNSFLSNFTEIFPTNPATGQQWAVSEVNSLQYGIKAIAR
jgi:hypothetical protein